MLGGILALGTVLGYYFLKSNPAPVVYGPENFIGPMPVTSLTTEAYKKTFGHTGGLMVYEPVSKGECPNVSPCFESDRPYSDIINKDYINPALSKVSDLAGKAKDVAIDKFFDGMFWIANKAGMNPNVGFNLY